MLIGGLDVGTTGCKLNLYDENGNSISRVYKEYDVKRNTGEHEINADEVWNCVKEIFLKTAEQETEVSAIGITTFGESFVMLDESDHVLLPSMLYTDSRGEKQCKELAEKLGEDTIMSITGVKPHCMYSLPKMMWIKEHLPDVYHNAKRIMLFEDFIVYRLTGIAQIDYSLAARTMALDIRNKCWDEKMLACSGIEKDKLSTPVAPGSIAGNIKAELAKELRFCPNLKIINGCHDQVAAAIGAGVFESGMAIDGTGTVECITPMLKEIPSDRNLFEKGYAVVPYVFPDTYVCYALCFTGGAALKWFRDTIVKYEAESAQKNGKNVYAVLDSKIPNDVSGLLVLPHFAGAATPYMDTGSKAAIIGLTLENTEYDIYKALMEGISFEILYNIECLEQTGIKLSMLRATGGGANSEVWLQIKADILNRPIIALDAKEAGTSGTAMLCAVAAGLCNNLEEAKNVFVKERKTYYPRTEKSNQYALLYDRYKKVYNAVRPLV